MLLDTNVVSELRTFRHRGEAPLRQLKPDPHAAAGPPQSVERTSHQAA